MNKKLLIFKRKKAKELHEKGWSNRKIARHLLASKNSVGKWVQMDESEISIYNRGGEKGKSRKYTPETKEHIINCNSAMKDDNCDTQLISYPILHILTTNSSPLSSNPGSFPVLLS